MAQKRRDLSLITIHDLDCPSFNNSHDAKISQYSTAMSLR